MLPNRAVCNLTNINVSKFIDERGNVMIPQLKKHVNYLHVLVIGLEQLSGGVKVEPLVTDWQCSVGSK